jgi:hypothetical protein
MIGTKNAGQSFGNREIRKPVRQSCGVPNYNESHFLPSKLKPDDGVGAIFQMLSFHFFSDVRRTTRQAVQQTASLNPCPICHSPTSAVLIHIE